MKSLFLKKSIFAILVVCLCFASCSKKEEKPADVTENTEVSNEIQAPAEQKNNDLPHVTGVIYVNGAALYTENEDGKMKWVASASIGDIAEYLRESKKAKRTDGQERNFFHISLKEKEYWIQDYCYEPNTVPAFVKTDETVLYKSDSLTAATDEIIPKYFIIAIYNEGLDETSKFLKFATYCPELSNMWIVKEKFIKRDAVEIGENNVQAMLLANVATESRNDTIRAELFQNAIEMNSEYSEDIAALQQLTETIIKEENTLKSLNIEKIEQKVTVNDEVNLQSIPGDIEPRFLATIKAGEVMIAYKKTTISEDSKDVDWYYVQKKQKKGWIQAHYLTLPEDKKE